jgi:hypothetical protein
MVESNTEKLVLARFAWAEKNAGISSHHVLPSRRTLLRGLSSPQGLLRLIRCRMPAVDPTRESGRPLGGRRQGTKKRSASQESNRELLQCDRRHLSCCRLRSRLFSHSAGYELNRAGHPSGSSCRDALRSPWRLCQSRSNCGQPDTPWWRRFSTHALAGCNTPIQKLLGLP